MYRRRRPKREIPFSFDSFLDLVANVCGIIIRLILVAWVGARSYHAVMAQGAVDATPEIEVAASEPDESITSLSQVAPPVVLPPITDPLESALQKHHAELARQQERLLEQLRQCQQWETVNAEGQQQLAMLAASRTALEQEQNAAELTAAQRTEAANAMHLSLADLEKRSQQLAKELKDLEALPPLGKTLRYRTPVSRPVHTEELHFECRAGRVSFIDVEAFQIEMRRRMENMANQLKSQWQVESTTGTIGAFRLHYVVERDRGILPGGVPDADSSFRYGISGWVVEPVLPVRGETAAEALSPGSEFHRLADAIDPEQTVITMWVYEDSFMLYRQLRDFLHERNIEVAGRPLTLDTPIASSRHGSASRGQ